MLGCYDYTVIATYISVLSALSGIFFCVAGKPDAAVYCLITSGLLDMLDGPIARSKKDRTAVQKAFGIQIDSLSDFMAFGVLPAGILFSTWSNDCGLEGWRLPVAAGASAFIALTALIRLAYFNVVEEIRQKESQGKRRTEFDLKKAKERAHILEGLKIALDFIDEVIAILRASKDIPSGRAALMERFGLTEVQAQAIVVMRLGQLTGLEKIKIEEELAALMAKIAELNAILADEGKVHAIIRDELAVIGGKYKDERRTEIQAVSGEMDIEDLIPVEDCVITLTHYGYMKRQNMDNYKTQRRGGRGISGMTRRDEDVATEMFLSNSHDYNLFFTNKGRVYRIKCYEIPESTRQSKGINIANILPLGADEKVTSMIRIPAFEEDKYLIMVTKQGIIKRIALTAYDTARKGGLIALDLNEGDELAWVRMTDGNNEVIIATKKGMAIRFRETDVRPMGRLARGVKAMKLKEGDSIVGMSIIEPDKLILTVSETGYGRLSSPDDYRLQSRGGKGLTNYHVNKYGDVAALTVVPLEDDVIIISENGVIIRILASTIRVCSRPAKGVTVMKIKGENKVVSVSGAPHDEDEAQSAENDENAENPEDMVDDTDN